LVQKTYAWGRVWVLNEGGRSEYFSFIYYVPSSESARTSLLRYVFAQVLQKRGYELRGRVGETLLFSDPDGRRTLLAAKWGGYAPAGLKRLYQSAGAHMEVKPERLLYTPAPGRRFHWFNRIHPEAEAVPKELLEETLGVFQELSQGLTTNVPRVL